MPEGTIIKALSGFYYVKNGDQLVQCRARGVFRKRGVSPLVGDHVVYEAAKPTDGYILSISKRKNVLKRPPIANIDQAILVFSVAEPALDCQLLDRFLISMEAHRIDPVICFTKWDLLSEKDIETFRSQMSVYEKIGYPILFTSSLKKEGLAELKQRMENRISVVTGQSGVGKSTLLNYLGDSLNIETQAISHALGRGKHTTRHVELLPISINGYVADTPGFSSLELPDIAPSDLEQCFPEFDEFREGCRFRGCMHLAEPDCMVKDAVSKGKIDRSRYEHYQIFLAELNERERTKY
ncbi:MAG: ribosome small subunit-dependent GTPase A [Sporolactobacillus sp.]|uniref:ribosome small subunit-dependent GTPase A n=1 Tax=Sporolactobacillus sp. STSJ-5 TaxID=2965076 RepID=UPI002104A2BD|nr:ribosome small subunit-dependent GTPase A [Sporolactobacillus sp. STSJ-5]MCQ2008913.1 ribosome small subunit-dependent GTPase A [Sporolactobacillus sp. STSJ-5]